jgi:hypothetical protein
MHEMIGEERDALARGVWEQDAGERLDGWDALDSGGFGVRLGMPMPMPCCGLTGLWKPCM